MTFLYTNLRKSAASEPRLCFRNQPGMDGGAAGIRSEIAAMREAANRGEDIEEKIGRVGQTYEAVRESLDPVDKKAIYESLEALQRHSTVASLERLRTRVGQDAGVDAGARCIVPDKKATEATEDSRNGSDESDVGARRGVPEKKDSRDGLDQSVVGTRGGVSVHGARCIVPDDARIMPEKSDKPITIIGRANGLAEKVGGWIPGTEKLSAEKKRVLGYAVTVGGVLMAALIASALSKSKKVFVGLLAGGAALVGLGIYADKFGKMHSEMEKAKEMYEKGREKAEEWENKAKEEGEALLDCAKRAAGEADEFSRENQIEEGAMVLKYKVSAALLVRVFGDEADEIGMEIFDKNQQRDVMLTMLGLSVHPDYGRNPPVKVSELLSADAHGLNQMLYSDSPVTDEETKGRRLKACEFVLKVFRKNERRMRENHAILSKAEGSQLPERFEDMTFEQAFNMLGTGPMHMLGSLAEHSAEMAYSVLPGLGGDVKDAVGRMLDAAKETAMGMSTDEFAHFLRFAPEKDRPRIRMKQFTEFAVGKKEKYAADLKDELEEGKSELRPEEKSLMIRILDEADGYVPIKADSMLSKACRDDRDVIKALENQWSNVKVGDKLQIFYLVQKGSGLPLSLKIAQILRGETEVFTKFASNIGTDCLLSVSRTSAGWLLGIEEMPEEWQRFVRMARREAGHAGGEFLKSWKGWAKSDQGTITIGGLLSWEAVSRLIKVKGWHLPIPTRILKYYMPWFGRRWRHEDWHKGKRIIYTPPKVRAPSSAGIPPRTAGAAPGPAAPASNTRPGGNPSRPSPAPMRLSASSPLQTTYPSAEGAPAKPASTPAEARRFIRARDALKNAGVSDELIKSLKTTDVCDNFAEALSQPEFADALSKHVSKMNPEDATKAFGKFDKAFGLIDDAGEVQRLARAMKSTRRIAKVVSYMDKYGDTTKLFRGWARAEKALNALGVAGDAAGLWFTYMEWQDTNEKIRNETDNKRLKDLYGQRYYYLGIEGVSCGAGLVTFGMASAGVGGAIAAPVAIATVPVSVVAGAAYAGHKWKEDMTKTKEDWMDEKEAHELIAALRSQEFFGETLGQGFDAKFGGWKMLRLLQFANPFTAAELYAETAYEYFNKSGDAKKLIDNMKSLNMEQVKALIGHTATVAIPEQMEGEDGKPRDLTPEEVTFFQKKAETYVKSKAAYIMSMSQSVTHPIKSGADVRKLMENAEYYALFMSHQSELRETAKASNENGDQETSRVLKELFDKDIGDAERAEKYKAYVQRQQVLEIKNRFLAMAPMAGEDSDGAQKEFLKASVADQLRLRAKNIILDFNVRCEEDLMGLFDGSQKGELLTYMMAKYEQMVEQKSAQIVQAMQKLAVAQMRGEEIDSRFRKPEDELESLLDNAEEEIEDLFLGDSPENLHQRLEDNVEQYKRVMEFEGKKSELQSALADLAALEEEQKNYPRYNNQPYIERNKARIEELAKWFENNSVLIDSAELTQRSAD